MRTWRWRIFGATWVAYAGLYFARKPFFVTKGTLTTEFGFDPNQLATIGTAYLVAYAIGQFIAGAAGTRWGPRLILLIGLTASLLCNVLFGLSNHLGSFALLMFFNGLAQSMGWAPAVGTMANWFGRDSRGTVMGWWNTHFTIGGIAANTLAAFALGQWGWRWSYFMGAAVVAVATVLVWWWHRNRPEDVGLEPVPEDSDGSAEAAARPDWVVDVLLMGTFYFFAKFIRYALWSWVPWVLQHDFGLAGDEAGYVSTVFDISGAVGAILCGWASDALFRGNRAATALASILVMMGVTGLLVLVGSSSLVVFVVCLGLIGFTLYGPDTLVAGAGAIEVGSRRNATMAAGIVNGMGSAGSVVQELLLGRLLTDGALNTVFLTLFGSAFGAAVLLGVVTWRSRRRSAV